MASVRAQILATVEQKLELVRAYLEWKSVVRNPREVVGTDQMNALVQMDGGDPEPSGLTGHVEQAWLEFSVGMLVVENGDASAEEMLDAALVALLDTLLDPQDIQLGSLAVEIRRGAISDPMIGRAHDGAEIVGGQTIDFTVQYLAREGDASVPGP